MRTSEELTIQHGCSNYRKDLDLSHPIPSKILEHAKEEIVLRLLQGEDIPNIIEELNATCLISGYKWENAKQQNVIMGIANKDIERFVNGDRRDKTFLCNQDNIVHLPILNEDINVKASYYTENQYAINIVKVKGDKALPKGQVDSTGELKPIREDEQYETYALAMLGKKILDERKEANLQADKEGKPHPYTDAECNKQIIVEYDHLSDPYYGKGSPKQERLRNADYFNEESDKTFTTLVDSSFMNFFEKKREQDLENSYTCSGNGCAGCGCNTACHYIEPPMVENVAEYSKSADDIKLTFAQKQAVNHFEGNMLINAGAGSGKTTVVSLRILNLIKNHNVDPSKIALLTFTNAASKEMSDRVQLYANADEQLKDVDVSNMWSGTFNKFCENIINEHYEELNYTRKPHVVSTTQKYAIINSIFNKYPKINGWQYNKITEDITMPKNNQYIDKKTTKIAYLAFTNIIDKIKSEGNMDIIDLNPNYSDIDKTYIRMMYDEYNDTLKANNVMEFQDEFINVNELVERNPTFFDDYGFEHIIVDEFQDTNPVQIELLKKIQNNASYKSLYCVGDFQQSIYGFLNATPEIMAQNNFQTNFGQYDSIDLIENHRCNRSIIGFVNNIIEIYGNKMKDRLRYDDDEVVAPRKLVAARDFGMEPIVEGFYSTNEQYKWIAKQIQRDIELGAKPEDIMFLTRNNDGVEKMGAELTKLGIPSVLRCQVPIIDNSNVATAVNFMDSFLYDFQEGYFDYVNTLSHGKLFDASKEIIDYNINALKEKINGMPHDADALFEILDGLDPDATDECYQQFLTDFKFCKTLDDVDAKLGAFKMHGKEDKFKRESVYSEVNLSTIHGSKGLESKIVYVDIANLDKREYHESNLRTNKIVQKDYDETTRLEYVAYTRAKDKLVISAPYVTPKTFNLGKNTYHLNERLLNAYKATGKVYGFNYQALVATTIKEKQQKDADKANTKTFFNVNLNQIRNEELSMKKERKEQEYNLEGQLDFSDIGLALS